MYNNQLTCNGHIEPALRANLGLSLWEYHVVHPNCQPNANDLTLMESKNVVGYGSVGLVAHYRTLFNVPEMVHCYLPTGSVWW